MAAIRSQPAMATGWSNLASLCRETGDLPQAVRCLEQVVDGYHASLVCPGYHASLVYPVPRAGGDAAAVVGRVAVRARRPVQGARPAAQRRQDVSPRDRAVFFQISEHADGERRRPVSR